MTERTARVVDLALLAIGVTVLWAVPHHIGSDGEVRLEALTTLLHERRLAIPRYSIVGPLFALPLHAIGQAALYNVTLFTLALAVVWRELRDVTLLVLLVFASMFGNHVQVFYGEPFTALAVTVGVLWLSRGLTVRGWTAIVLGAVNTPASVLGVAAIALLEARRTRRLAPFAAPIAVLLLACLENLVMRGGLLRTGYESDSGFRTVMPYSGLPGFSYPMFFGLLAIFLSFGKGLIFFTPGLFLPPAREEAERVRRIRVLLASFVVGLVLVYARWWSWYGGNFWGPRFFLASSVPACVALAGHLRSREARRPRFNAVLAVALVLSFWVGVNGIVFDQSGLGICSRDDYALEALCHFTPEYSPLWHPFVQAKVTPLGIAVLVIWAIACAWIGRDVFAQLGRDVAKRVDVRRR
jgi:hypothetical protein